MSQLNSPMKLVCTNVHTWVFGFYHKLYFHVLVWFEVQSALLHNVTKGLLDLYSCVLHFSPTSLLDENFAPTVQLVDPVMADTL